MKKLLFAALISFVINTQAQVTLDHVYDSASVWNTCSGNYEQLMLVNFEVSGYQYVKVNRCGKVINIYDMSHALVQTISMASFPTNPPYATLGDIIYLSETLFNTNPKKEFMYCYDFTDTHGNGQHVTNIYDENATLLFTDTSSPIIKPNFEQQQYPIYNTPNGTKMILSCTNGQAKVFSLGGTLSCSAPCNSGMPSNSTTGLKSINQTNNGLGNAYPNPTATTTSIDYTLPNGVNIGEIIFYNAQGVIVKRFKVDNTFSTLSVSTTDISAGTYYYQLQTNGTACAAKKIVVIK